MKAAFIETTGRPDVIRYGDLPDPEPQAGEVLVKVAAVARQPDRHLHPRGHGADAAAEAVHHRLRPGRRRRRGRARGARASRSATASGARTRGCSAGRGRSPSTAASHEDWLYPTPAGVKDEDAAAVALVGITAHLGLFLCAKLQAGETVFVNGGTGGVGSMVVQMAKAVGAKVDHHGRLGREGRSRPAHSGPTWRSTTRPTTWPRRSRSSPAGRA